MYEEELPVFQRIHRRRDERSGGGKFGCNKRGFRSYREAKNLLRRGWADTMGRVAPYHCADCKHWHLGNPTNFKRIA